MAPLLGEPFRSARVPGTRHSVTAKLIIVRELKF